jgi:hypothetical protein
MKTLERKSDLPQIQLEGILLTAGVPVKHWTEWFDLVYLGARPSDAARHCKGSAKALPAILKAISDRYFKKLGVRFPPKNWKPTRKQLAAVA